MSLPGRSARKIRIHCPIEPATFTALMAGDLAAIERDRIAARMLAIIRADNALGDFGRYRSVFEISFGLEGFTPTADATPALGNAEAHTLSQTAVITTYVDMNSDVADLEALISQLVAAHPWEIPVIELTENAVTLIDRSSASPSKPVPPGPTAARR